MRLAHRPQEAAVHNGKTPDRCLSHQETRVYAIIVLAESVQEAAELYGGDRCLEVPHS